MTDDEVLVFKQLEIWKDDPLEKREEIAVRGCFHTAFDYSNTQDGAPRRQSAEYRMLVFVGKKRGGEDDSNP
eukprot:CAMPEP_0202032376 /NCGR_PEP_ID=MMETSP0905-20130828/65496_1 /ASSEMBLY_ACC=CAM_ASM_000554 /TAXON_ID=420261 /ORGANISM="Thalassiosira antarctica, Strain CCMP982" /LENGTH=71 /DNA_ID=CAMNT_0048596235 /DNA_START=663 /DNA_END=878 /DNA_ORIENTATION=-